MFEQQGEVQQEENGKYEEVANIFVKKSERKLKHIYDYQTININYKFQKKTYDNLKFIEIQ